MSRESVPWPHSSSHKGKGDGSWIDCKAKEGGGIPPVLLCEVHSTSVLAIGKDAASSAIISSMSRDNVLYFGMLRERKGGQVIPTTSRHRCPSTRIQLT